MTLSKRSLRINPSPTLAITAKAKEMKKQGIDVISFGAGEPDFDTPDHIKKAAVQAINEGFTKYTATSGIQELKQVVCEKLKKDNHLSYIPQEILVSTGAKQCLYNIIQVLINPEDEVIIPSPYWVSYEEMVKLADGVCIFLPTVNFKINAPILEKAVTKKTKALILNSPSNPTGTVYDRKELEAVAKVCIKHHIYVISDEIYEPLIYGKKHISIASLNKAIKKLSIVVNGVSKTYSMTGWRIGYCAGEKEIIKAAASLQDHSTSNPNSIAQKAALAALKGPQGMVSVMRDTYKKRRDYMVGRLQKIKGLRVQKPDGAFYVFINISSLYTKHIAGSVEFCSRLLEKAHIAAIPGKAFGDDRYMRLSYATSDENIRKGLDRLESFIGNLLQ